MKAPRVFLFVALAVLLRAAVAPSQTRAENRTYDGTDNNLVHPNWGAAGIQLLRMAPSDYGDGISAPAGADRPNPRDVSNMVVAQAVMMPNTHSMTDWVFQWGQFIDHDIDLTEGADPAEAFNIPIPMGDPVFDPMGTGAQVMSFNRSAYDPTSGNETGNPRQQINQITAYIDASNVYGSDSGRAFALREMSGGRLKTSTGNLLPFNTLGLPNASNGPVDPATLYVAGDVRANEQMGLTAVHTLFLREHNRLADEIAAGNPGWSDEQIYQRARKIVGAEIQAITYNEFLPALLGSMAPSVESTYDATLNASILNEFSTALYRVGHTMLPPRLMRMEDDGSESPDGSISLRDAFFVPASMGDGSELPRILKGLASEMQQNVDTHMVDDVRNFLFGGPFPAGFDLASLNIQRGRDHGLPDYNTMRVAFGLDPISSFAEITSNVDLQISLETLYDDVDAIDAWVGALAEDHHGDMAVGELVGTALKYQFTKLRDGDRFWFLNDSELSDDDKDWLLSLRLSDVIRANTSITNLQDNVFFMAVPEPMTLALASLAACAALHRRRLCGA